MHAAAILSRHKILLLATALALPAVAATAHAAEPAAPATAATGAPASDSVDLDAVQETVVTGLRGGSRAAIDSPSPIDVVGSAALAETGKVGLKELLNQLVPSFNLPGVNGGGTSWTVRSTTMRGLNGDQALVLVNGKRRHNTALINNLARIANGGVPVDLDLIPVGAIDHIEVLRDGAAAQYGSDAIAGVINVILKNAPQGGSVESSLGQNYGGDGFTKHVAANYGLDLPRQGFLNLSADYKDNQSASRAAPTSVANLYNPLANGARDPREATADRTFYGNSYGPGQETIYSGSYNAELPVGDDVTLYSFSTASKRRSRKNTGSFLPNNINSLPEVYPNGFNALRRIWETDFQTTVGGRGEIASWSWDLSTTYGRDDAKLDGENTLNATLGPTSPTYFHLADQIFDQVTTDLDVSRALNLGLPAPVTVAWGLEHRYERYEIDPGDPASYIIGSYVIPSGYYAGQHPQPGLASYTGTSPADSGAIARNNGAAYIDLATNLTPAWSLDAAGRVEHYTGAVGDTASGKLATRYELAPGYALRGTVSNGFRAPSLAQTIYASSTFTGTVDAAGNYITLPIKVLPATSGEAKALGATPLTPETSTNYSVGVTAEPVHNLQLTLDAYRIDIKDRIVETGLLTGNAVSAILQRAGFAPGLSAQYYTNAVDTRTEGVDAVANYLVDLGDAGDVRLGAAYSWTRTYITHIKPTPTQLSSLGYALFDRQRQADLTDGTPRGKAILSANWHWDRLHVDTRLTRYGSYTEAGTVAANDRTFSAKWITDLDVGVDLTDRISVSLGANNLFDVYPDAIGIVDAKTGLNKYGLFSPFGITGGYYYSRVSVKF
ncbi:TonB-dependent receptor [Nitrospirillum sp. BR 11163]|uniref:TonB-dependent receptor plug domain-containing protein n=1 Tax=Nitrospirillum sp. BR 11163 TaxID=3104323 RepID=UPI002AFDDF99|nr:TonB-dependent receptor [Nitrospirillum sp. BR 11163]MEA1673644.1 TonB-dependent receptor [Nitrospirillum sp. BR 11163]